MPDRTALVTGGAGGLGRSVVDALVADGWDVVVPVEAGSDIEARDGVSTVVADLTDPDDVARAIRAAGEHLGAVVNLVGGFAADQPVADTPITEFERMFRSTCARPTWSRRPRSRASETAARSSASAPRPRSSRSPAPRATPRPRPR